MRGRCSKVVAGGRRTSLALLVAALFLTPSCSPEDGIDPAQVESIKLRLMSQEENSTTDSPPVGTLELETEAEEQAKKYLELIRDRYIVVLDENAILTLGNGDPAALANRHGVTPHHVYRHALRGFSATLGEQQLESLRSDPQVQSIQPDGLMHTTDLAVPYGIDRVDADVNPTARIDASDERVGVAVAIIDTGIDLDHPDLNVQGGVDLCTIDDPTDTLGDDLMGHGTHCAGTVGALDDGYDFGLSGYRQAVMGVAPGVPLWAVRVLDYRGYGTASDIISGIDWIADCVSTGTSCPPAARDIKVANMSLGCECDDPGCWCDDDCSGVNCSDALRIAIDGVVAAGVTLVTSAGNDAREVGTQSSCLVSPSCYDSPIVVAAMTDFDGARGSLSGCPSNCGYTSNTDDDISSYSNFGAQVDIIAPGTCIRSTYHKTGCNDCVLAAEQCTGERACTTTPGSYRCCNSACNGCSSVEYHCPVGKNGLCFDGDGNVYCCVHALYTMMSGTSMASPHVAGGAALFIDEYHRNHGAYPTPAQVKAGLTTNGDALPCGSGTGSSCTSLPGTPGLFVGEHRDSIEGSGYTVDDLLLSGDGFAARTIFEAHDGIQSVGMGVHDSTTGGTPGYSLVNFCLSKDDLSSPIDDFFKASAWVKFDSHTDWTGFGISTENSSDVDVWLYWWWIRADGTVLDTLDRLGGASVFGTTAWHNVEITVDRRDPVATNHVASLSVDGAVETDIPLSNWDATTEGMRCLFFFSGVTEDTYQDMYVDQVYIRARPGGVY